MLHSFRSLIWSAWAAWREVRRSCFSITVGELGIMDLHEMGGHDMWPFTHMPAFDERAVEHPERHGHRVEKP